MSEWPVSYHFIEIAAFAENISYIQEYCPMDEDEVKHNKYLRYCITGSASTVYCFTDRPGIPALVFQYSGAVKDSTRLEKLVYVDPSLSERVKDLKPENPTPKELAERVKCYHQYLYAVGRDRFAYQCRLKYQGKTMACIVEFHTSKEPNAYDVLSCLCSDTMVEAYEQTEKGLADWAEDMGREAGSDEAREIWMLSWKNTRRLHRFLGDDYDLFVEAQW